MNCNSCNKPISNDNGSAKFPCPKCGQQKIVRCTSCRKSGAQYSCPECNFTGPN
ncbi:DUF1610 domain-containing protein [Candidatus Woesearchaeota archaeon]|nr:DUF1610 domain-containing protein [Candidatus Woesearchaeota archaeon]